VRILLVGGTGFVGGAVLRRLLTKGHEVAAFHRGESSGGAHTIRGDRRELPAYRDAFRTFGPEVVLDTIAYTRADAEGLAQAFRGLTPRLVVLSSQDVYAAYGRLLRLEGGAPDSALLSEDAPLRSSRFPYRAISKPGEMAFDYEKIQVEQAVSGRADISATVLRLPFVYGPGDRQRRLKPYLEGMAQPRMPLDRAKAAWRSSRGYVEDVAEAIAVACVDPRAAGRTYNLGEPDPLTEADWVSAIGQAAGWEGAVHLVPREELPEGLAEPYDFAHDLASDTRRIRDELGFREPVGRAEGLRRTVAWEREA
jgi:nucleoside-diphosphate-sugar epimerase